jgi:hypothetical protein
VIHSRPVSGDFTIKILVTDGSPFQLRPKRFDTPIGYEVLHCLKDEPAALAGFDHPVNGLDRSLRQYYVDAFAHEDEN